jgi:hypothetical protein
MVIASKPSCCSWFEGVLERVIVPTLLVPRSPVDSRKGDAVTLGTLTPAQPALIEPKPTGNGSGLGGVSDLIRR